MLELAKTGIGCSSADGFIRILDSRGRLVMNIDVFRGVRRESAPRTLHFESKLVQQFTAHVVTDIRFAMELLDATSK